MVIWHRAPSGQNQLGCRCYVSPPVTSQRVFWTEESIASLGNGRRWKRNGSFATSRDTWHHRHIMGTHSHLNRIRSHHASTPGHYSRGLPRWSPFREWWYRRILDISWLAQRNRRGHIVPWPCCRTPVSPWQGPSNPPFRTPGSIIHGVTSQIYRILAGYDQWNTGCQRTLLCL